MADISRRKPRYTAAALLRALNRIRDQLSPESFAAFIRTYHFHWSISLEYNEHPPRPLDFFNEWSAVREREKAAVATSAEVNGFPSCDYSSRYTNTSVFALDIGESSALYRRWRGK